MDHKLHHTISVTVRCGGVGDFVTVYFFFSDAQREFNHLSTNLYKASDYDRLSLSLVSPLPNEQDFAINVCTLLSNDGKHTLKLDKHPTLINYLLAHAGVFSHSKYIESMTKLCFANINFLIVDKINLCH